MKSVLTLLFLLLASSAFAQNPTTIDYLQSPDHNTTVGTPATPLVIRYDAVIKKLSDGSTVTTKDCGKPVSSTTAQSCALPNGLPGNTNLTATIMTVWSGGSVPSVASDPFVVATAPAAAGKPTVH